MGTHRPSRSQNVQFRIQRQSRHRKQIRMARLLWRPMSRLALESLRELVKQYDAVAAVNETRGSKPKGPGDGIEANVSSEADSCRNQ